MAFFMNNYKHFIPFIILAVIAYGAFFTLKAPPQSLAQRIEK